MTVWFTSDMHFGHNQEFIWKARGFSSIEEHDEAIIRNWNETVSQEDKVYILGDLMLGNNTHGMDCIKQLNGEKYIIIGNHDTDTRVKLYPEIGNILGYASMVKFGKQHIYLSHYPTLTSNNEVGRSLHAKTICLCGHTHTTDKWADWDKGLIYHVEMDCHDMKPVNLETVIGDISEKIFGQEDTQEN